MLVVLTLGYFMILVDATIRDLTLPTMEKGLHPSGMEGLA